MDGWASGRVGGGALVLLPLLVLSPTLSELSQKSSVSAFYDLNKLFI